MIKLSNLKQVDDLFFVGHIADIDGDGWVSKEEASSIIASINRDHIPDTLEMWKDGDFIGKGGFFIRNDLKDFLIKLMEAGHEPVGIRIDMDSFNLEVIVKED